MTLSLEDKKAIVADLNAVAANAVSVVVADYRGLTVTEMTSLRESARQKGLHLEVARNTLAKRALCETAFECMNESLVGPLIFVFSHEAPGAAAKLFHEFSKEHENLEVKALSLGGKVLDGSAVERVANLPTKDEAISLFMSVMKAPVTKFVRTLAEPHAKLVRTVAVVAAQKKQAA